MPIIAAERHEHVESAECGRAPGQREARMIGGRSWELLKDGSVLMSLERACVETTARRVQREIVRGLLEGWLSPAGAGAGLDTLREFLRTADFAALRSQQPELSGEVPCRIKVIREAERVVCRVLEARNNPTRPFASAGETKQA
jgi:hypothetical protein